MRKYRLGLPGCSRRPGRRRWVRSIRLRVRRFAMLGAVPVGRPPSSNTMSRLIGKAQKRIIHEEKARPEIGINNV